MPSTYAHYRMGCRSIQALSPKLQTLIQEHRRMYELGLHGPDFLYFHNPLKPDNLYHLADRVHRHTGRAFFEPALGQLKQSRSENQCAYVFGVLAHFALDSMCHPYINEEAGKGLVGHTEMETEFDRFLLELDGKKKPYREILTRHLRLSGQEDAAEIAALYSGLKPQDVRSCFARFRWLINFCTAPRGLRRFLLEKGVFSESARQQIMTISPNFRCALQTEQIKSRYDQAEILYPRLAQQMLLYLQNQKALGPEFDRIFG